MLKFFWNLGLSVIQPILHRLLLNLTQDRNLLVFKFQTNASKYYIKVKCADKQATMLSQRYLTSTLIIMNKFKLFVDFLGQSHFIAQFLFALELVGKVVEKWLLKQVCNMLSLIINIISINSRLSQHSDLLQTQKLLNSLQCLFYLEKTAFLVLVRKIAEVWIYRLINTWFLSNSLIIIVISFRGLFYIIHEVFDKLLHSNQPKIEHWKFVYKNIFIFKVCLLKS